ncbi:MAG: glycosyltransferase [Bacteroidaceae bacterium]|nr:glycosyltransferase [Bacteroidaceae bacterium]
MFNKSIVFVNRSRQLERGGAGKMTMYVANICATIFEKVYVILLSDGKRPETLDKRISFINIPRSNSKNLIIWRSKEIITLRKAIRNINPNIVCPFVSDVAVVSRIATLGLSVTFCPAERGDPYTMTFPWNILVKWTYSHSDYCFFQLDKARDYFGTKVINKSFVIPNPYLPKNNQKPYFGERKQTIVSAGRFEREKCYADLINAFSIVYKKHPEYKLIIWGDGSLLRTYKTQVEQLGLNEVVSFPGYTWDIPETIKYEGIFVLPSLYEGIPNVLIDALSVGIPVVSTDCTPGGPFFLTDSGKNGLLVPVKSPDKLAEAILKIIDNSSLADELSRKGPSILSSISVDRISEMWINSFENIVNAKLYNI